MPPADKTSRTPETPRPVRVAAMGAGARALAMAVGIPGIAVDVFESDWRAIDRLRHDAAQHGLAERVHIHHAGALELTDLTAYAVLINGEAGSPI